MPASQSLPPKQIVTRSGSGAFAGHVGISTRFCRSCVPPIAGLTTVTLDLYFDSHFVLEQGRPVHFAVGPVVHVGERVAHRHDRDRLAGLQPGQRPRQRRRPPACSRS